MALTQDKKANIAAPSPACKAVTSRNGTLVHTTSRLTREFFQRDARAVARDLLGRMLVTLIDGVRCSGRIVETEAYLGVDDPASHSHSGQTLRNRSMFLEGGHAYVYLIYGMHYCFNVVTGGHGEGEAVLIRGIEAVEGVETMRTRRGERARSDRDLTNGPAKLAVALGIGPALDGGDLSSDPRIWIDAGEPVPETLVLRTERVGITKAAELPFRFLVSRASG